jgi:cation diffusion facilitator family transporter
VESDLLKNIGLLTAVFLSYLSIRKVNRGKTDCFNYGYGKLESFSGLIVAAVLGVALMIVVHHIAGRLLHPIELPASGLDKAIVLCAVILTASATLWLHDYHLSRKEHSPIMESLWRLYRFKTIAMGFVILSLGTSLVFAPAGWADYVDPLCSILVGLFIVHAIYGIFTMSVSDLLDRTLEESLQLVILRELATYFEKYEAIHGIRSRRSGANVYVEIFLEFDRNRKMGEVQDIINAMKRDLEKMIHGSQVVISPATAPVR